MKKTLILCFLLCLQACSDPAKEIKVQDPKVVQLFTADLTNITSEYEFPATVSSVKSVDLKFEVSGRLVFANLVEGSAIAKGDILARIDSAPFERRVAEAKIRYDDAVRDLARIEEVFQKNVASQSAFDNAKSLHAITKLALANAKQDLSYCTIKAPFDGIVAARQIENNSYISAGDTIANLQDRSKLYFSFDVPERIMTANAGNRDINATAHIIGQEENIFDIYYVEHQTTPNPITQTYSVTFALDGEAVNLFYPGSRASVKIQNKLRQQNAILVPIAALMGDKNKGFSVWLYDSKSGEVHPVKVEIANLQGEYAVIASGIKAGDKLVSAGINQMSDGLKVKEYKADY